MSPQIRRALKRGVCAFLIFSTFFLIVAIMFVEPGPVAIGRFRFNRQSVAAVAIYLHGFVIAWIEFQRGLKEQPRSEETEYDH
jgi:hypothetical protein